MLLILIRMHLITGGKKSKKNLILIRDKKKARISWNLIDKKGASPMISYELTVKVEISEDFGKYQEIEKNI